MGYRDERKKSQVGNATLDEAELKMISTNAFAKRDQVEISLLKKTSFNESRVDEISNYESFGEN
ncbi:hypothetical protein [Pseudomonas jessenii]|jgi:hypothetical protein|uniref:hypothetical protein n=1 Tax=Pseudomonas jessenii TaxID=77298 RepID=UPI0030C287E5